MRVPAAESGRGFGGSGLRLLVQAVSLVAASPSSDLGDEGGFFSVRVRICPESSTQPSLQLDVVITCVAYANGQLAAGRLTLAVGGAPGVAG